jgi:hypothetical protein
VSGNGPIPPFADHFIAKNQQRPDWHLAVSGSALRKNERTPHEISIAGGIHGGPGA